MCSKKAAVMTACGMLVYGGGEWRDPLQLREPAVLGAGGACSAFPSGEGGRAQRGRMRFVPLALRESAVPIAGAMPPQPSPLGKVAERSEVG